MIGTARRAEVGLPWYERHAFFNGREIFQWTYGDRGAPSPHFPLPHIAGSEWENYESMQNFYAVATTDPRPVHEFSGFLRYAPSRYGSFASWEEAEAWLLGREDDNDGA